MSPVVLRAHGQFGFFDWRIESRSKEARIAVRFHAAPEDFVSLSCDNPPGGAKTCLNSKLASCELTLEERGRPPRGFIARHRAAFEILTERKDHGIAIGA
jgi:hypothetical protein